MAKKIYGLIGYPLGHSFSSKFFNDKFASEHIDAEYLNFELPDIGDLMEVIAEYPGLCGLNVTIPYKEAVIPYLEALEGEAAEAGAVNVIKIIRREKEEDFGLRGYNTDIEGFRESVRPLLTPARRHALVLGTGGASKAVRVALASLGVESTMVSHSGRDGAIAYGDITPEVMDRNKIIVNTTPLGMYPKEEECPDIPYRLLTPEHLCYDLVYNPDITKFMRLAAENGADVKNGLEMLVLQAQASWRVWNN